MTVPLPRYAALLATYLRPQAGKVVLLAVLLLANVGLQVLTPQVLRVFIDGAGAGQPLRSLLTLAWLFLGLALLRYLAGIGETYLGEDVAWTATNALRVDLTGHLLRLDMSFHTMHTPGELVERVDGDVGQLATLLSSLVFRVLAHLVLAAGVLLALALVDWHVGAALAAYALVALLVLIRLRGFATARARGQAAAALSGFLEERLLGTQDLRALGATGHQLHRLGQVLRALRQTEMAVGLRSTLLLNATWGLALLSQVLALALGAALYRAGTLTLGTVFLLYQYTQTLVWPLQSITQEVQNLQQIGASLLRIDELFGLRSAITEDGPAQLPAGALSVEVTGLSFGYSPERPVLHDLSFRLEAGRVLGLLGRTSSGKTTLARLLFRLYEPQAGHISLGEVDLRLTARTDLRGRVGLVTQEVQLFAASLRDNLTLFDRSIPDAQVRGTIDDLGLDGWYAALPAGLDTVLAAGGGGLSAGEAQLLALVRVFLRDPGLVILDEASSRLDPATERLLDRAMQRLLEGRTGIVIAHRLATLRHVDEVLVLDEGRVVEQGPRARLAGDAGSTFSRLLRTAREEALA